MMRSFAFVWSTAAGAVTLLLLATANHGLAQTTITIAGDQDGDGAPTPEAVRFASLDGGGFASHGAAMDVTMPADVGAAPIEIAHGEARLGMEQLAAVQRDAGGAVVSRTTPQRSRASLVDAQTIRYHDLYPGTDDEYTLSATTLKHDWVLERQPALPAQTAWYGYEVRLTLSSDLTVESEADGFVVLDAHGETLFQLPPVVAMDAAGRDVAGQYRVLEQRDGELRLGVEVAAAWLSTASYPVRIDPTIVTVDSTSTTGNAWPFAFNGPFTYQQSYSATQMQQTSGLITHIGFEFTGTINGSWPECRIYIGETTRNSTNYSYTFADNFDAVAATLAYDDSLSIVGSSWEMIALDTPVYYSGQNTLLIQIELEPPTNGGTSVFRVFGGGPVECFRVYDRNSSTATVATQESGYYFLHARFEIMGNPTIDTTSLPDGMEGSAYSETLQASGGSTPYTWSQTGLPGNLSLNSSTGEISGTPDASDVGTHTVDVTVSDASSNTDNESFTLVIHERLEITTASLPDGMEGSAYNETVQATGGATPYSWSQTGLPGSLSLDATTGAITGTPDASDVGTHNVDITVTDDNSETDTESFTLVIHELVEITTSALADGVEGNAYSETVQAAGGVTPYSWSQVGLPGNLTLDAATGEISGTPDASDVGTHSVDITVVDVNNATDTETFTLEIHPRLAVDSITLPEGTETGAYPSVTVTASGGMGPYSWNADGLPAGLGINASTGEISGTLQASTEGSHTVEITATDANSDTDTYVTTLDVNPPPQITSDTLPRINPNESWGPYPIEHQGGTAPLTFSAVDLPVGLTLNAATGEVSGEVEPGVVTSETRFEATVTDANGVTHMQEIGFVTHTIGAGSSRGCDCTTTAPHPVASNAPWLLLLLLALVGWRVRASGGAAAQPRSATLRC